MQWSDDVRIETPEQIDVALELAGLGSRFVARVLDWLIKWGVLAVAGVLGLIAFLLLGGTLGDRVVRIFVLTFLVGLFYAFLLGYDIYFEVRHNGQTPGKRAAGIRVLREGGAPLDFRSACIRNLLGMADFLPVFYLLGGFLVLLTSRHQRLGDLAAGTLVIRERTQEAPVDLGNAIEPLATPEITFTADQLAACSPDSRYILRSFFQRYSELEPYPRRQLACRLAAEFAGRVSYPLRTPFRAEDEALAFLASLYRDLESLRRHAR